MWLPKRAARRRRGNRQHDESSLIGMHAAVIFHGAPHEPTRLRLGLVVVVLVVMVVVVVEVEVGVVVVLLLPPSFNIIPMLRKSEDFILRSWGPQHLVQKIGSRKYVAIILRNFWDRIFCRTKFRNVE